MSLTEKEVVVCNQALDRINSTNFTFAVQTKQEGIKANTHYTQTRDALLRSFEWSFAKARAALVADTNTPDFEWDYQFNLPADYLRQREVYGVGGLFLTTDRWVIEGNKLLTNDSTADLKYIKKVTDPDDFDPLFTEVLILQLVRKFLSALAGTETSAFRKELLVELKAVMSKARVVCRQESNVSGRSDWNLARFRSRGA